MQPVHCRLIVFRMIRIINKRIPPRPFCRDARLFPGDRRCDAEVKAMLARAQPLPVFPETMKGGYLDVVVPIEFSLRDNS